jgi:uncharacterized protein
MRQIFTALGKIIVPTTAKSIFFTALCLNIVFAILVVPSITISRPPDNIVYAVREPMSNQDPVQNKNTTTITPTNPGISNNSHTLTVTGSATTSVKPDKVIVSLGVQTTNNTAKAALDTNSKSMNKVLEALLAAGVKQNETSTSSFSISPNYNYSQGRNIITGFTVTNSIQIESSKVANISKWLDTAISAGTNTVNSIDFTLSDKKLAEIKNGLIKLAIDDARNRANFAASASGLKVIGVRSISLNEFASTPQPMPLALQKLSVPPPAGGTPIISGQQQVSESVSITFLAG